jgi:hypothetical protein
MLFFIKACLAAIILSALKNLLKQIEKLPFYYRVNKIEFVRLKLREMIFESV